MTRSSPRTPRGRAVLWTAFAVFAAVQLTASVLLDYRWPQLRFPAYHAQLARLDTVATPNVVFLGSSRSACAGRGDHQPRRTRRDRRPHDPVLQRGRAGGRSDRLRARARRPARARHSATLRSVRDQPRRGQSSQRLAGAVCPSVPLLARRAHPSEGPAADRHGPPLRRHALRAALHLPRDDSPATRADRRRLLSRPTAGQRAGADGQIRLHAGQRPQGADDAGRLSPCEKRDAAAITMLDIDDAARSLRDYRPGGNAAAALERLLCRCRDNGIEPILLSVPLSSAHRRRTPPPLRRHTRRTLRR